jgi:hypothetical protein
MVRQSEVQKLEEEAQELSVTVSEQSQELKKLQIELEDLRCRTPRPHWSKLHNSMYAAGASSPPGPAEPAQAHMHPSSRQFAEQLSNRVIEHARSLQVNFSLILSHRCSALVCKC